MEVSKQAGPSWSATWPPMLVLRGQPTVHMQDRAVADKAGVQVREDLARELIVIID